MLVPKVFLSKDLSNEELYEIVKDGLGIGEIKEIKMDLNNIEVITEWGRFELRLDGRELSIHQRWNKDKMAILIGLIVISLFIWIPFLFILYKMYQERKTAKEILDQVGQRVND